MSAGVYNMTIEQGATFLISFTWKDSTGAAIDLTDYVITSKLKRKLSDIIPVLEFTCEVLVAANGTFQISLTAAQTALLPTMPNTNANKDMLSLYYDILATKNDDSSIIRILEGIAYISPRVT